MRKLSGMGFVRCLAAGRVIRLREPVKLVTGIILPTATLC